MSTPTPSPSKRVVEEPEVESSVREKAELPWRMRLAYGAGGMVERIGNQTIKDLGNPLYNLVLGINPATIGLVIMLTRLFDAFFDPIVGNWSDNARTRWGRRKPFMMAGALLSGVALVPVFWMPAWLEANAQFVWMLFFGIVFYGLFTLFSVPYRALAYEIAPGYHEKTQLLAVRTVFGVSVSIMQPWIFPLTQSGLLGDPRDSIPWLIGGLGLVLTLAAFIPIFGVKEPPLTPSLAAQRRIPLRESLYDALRCRPFLLILAASTASMIGVNLSFGFGNYISIYYTFGGDAKAASLILGWSGMIFVFFAMLAAPVMSVISKHVGKRNTQMGAVLVSAVGAAASWWLYAPSHPWLQLLLPLFVAPGMLGLWMFGESMVGDICQVEALRTGERREAVFSAVFGWILKAAAAVAVLGSNLLLNATGFQVALGGDQPPGAVTAMRIIFIVFLLVGFLGSFFLLWRYRIDEKMMLDVRRQLDAREQNI